MDTTHHPYPSAAPPPAAPRREASAAPPGAPAATGAREHLLDPSGLDRYRSAVAQGVERVARHVAAAQKPATGADPAALQRAVDAVDLDAPLGEVAPALDELEQLYLRDAVWFHHPTYLAHLNCPVVLPAVLGETVIAAVNSSLDTWDQSSGATHVERRLVRWTADRLGLPATADGVFTSGGTQSNLQGLLLARDEACDRLRAQHPDARLPELLGRLRVLVSEVGHFSTTTACRLLGLGEDAVIAVPVDDAMRMRPDALQRALTDCAQRGLVPAAVVATAGTTDFGSIDPLARVGALAERAGAWFHVDAAYGGGLITSRRRRHLLDGIDRADSVTVDFHKTFFQPVSSSVLLVRDSASLRHVAHHADYLNPEPELLLDAGLPVAPDQVGKSLQTTRRFDALKLWLTLRVMGADAVGDLVDAVIDTASAAHRVLAADPRLDVVVAPELSTLVFTFRPGAGPHAHLGPLELDRLVRRVRASVGNEGRAVLGGTTVRGRAHLKLTLLNPATTVEHVREVIALVHEHAERLLLEDEPLVLDEEPVGATA
ncbi:L-2,4-diaminobutyrate decarboxylase [Quadrisphaera granulorum]|uniref:L-2,4-diaminobutyrate decarboxylase n=1 Tax=Quadrisphaera granulorum TaxID=317664 RepID=A0A316A7F3_9ACTN|nr:aspartate aminotransferase family protein [Quadrisphaera granulorum]PWJ53645.1 L-2,4-diaminobutyrate decarboxylase [Quadrisphaera granulorum]SZE96689.1 L-2,4-diaminobutyrate decarboxylase [Quadrisphaera granulorum]